MKSGPNMPKNVRNWPVMKSKCATCPFGEGGDLQIRTRVEKQVVGEASQICHHPKLSGKKETHLCRGARDFQLQIFFRMGFLSAPTDQAWKEKIQELGI